MVRRKAVRIATRPVRISEQSYRYLKTRAALTDESITDLVDRAVEQFSAAATQRLTSQELFPTGRASNNPLHDPRNHPPVFAKHHIQGGMPPARKKA